jgi:hypothetical protein
MCTKSLTNTYSGNSVRTLREIRRRFFEALQTDQGNNASAASATLTVTGSTNDEIFRDGFDGNDPP